MSPPITKPLESSRFFTLKTLSARWPMRAHPLGPPSLKFSLNSEMLGLTFPPAVWIFPIADKVIFKSAGLACFLAVSIVYCFNFFHFSAALTACKWFIAIPGILAPKLLGSVSVLCCSTATRKPQQC